MNIPQVNAGVTDRNREQTKRICGLVEGNYKYMEDRFGYPVADSLERKRLVRLPNGSFTLDQVVGMLEENGTIYANGIWRFKDCCGWGVPVGCACKVHSHEVVKPHDLTAAKDTLIKVLEAKQ